MDLKEKHFKWKNAQTTSSTDDLKMNLKEKQLIKQKEHA